MDILNLQDMVKGWCIGNFEPCIYKTELFEVAIKQYKENEEEKSHYHKIATEYTIVVEGIVEFNGKEYKENSILVINPNEVIKFKSITKSKTVVIKIPSSIGDKFEIEDVNI